MISITIHPQSAAHVDIVAKAMSALLSTITPPAAQIASPEQMAKAIEHAEEIQKAKVAKPPKPAPVQKAEPAADTPAAAEPEVTTAPTAPATTATASPSEVSTTIEYALVGKAITDMVKTNREHAVATLAKYGAKKGTELKPEDYAAFLKELG